MNTSDGTEAKRRVCIGRIKVEAEFDDARVVLERQRAAAKGARAAKIALTQEQVWALATQWFVEQEKAGASTSVEIGDDEVIQNVSEDLVHAERFDEVSASVKEEVDKLLAAAGIQSGNDMVEPAGRKALAGHSCGNERERRLLNRVLQQASP